MNNKQTEYRKFKCDNCGTKYKTKIFRFHYCANCGNEMTLMLADLSIPKPEPDLKRQWLEALGPGWPCEVWQS